ncbi:type 1 glutamine amidotransferase [Zymomonas mobilis]|uniref:type 1 glutamine amidotransferase n=1 Tax=Zymomonas mobilis TaxID=542 RepID=UPI0003C76CBC|nr:type 1 glutamine amidotransferase [Zymomonas mobilis]AHB10609.1 GMP synthase family protein [Zymomonas mobilis subsp. mobilis str. CP4 = NRRL B-14023]AHJ70921.1 glutamine amidotransferase [Zymomonas mobilis subsp. mobilis NRRL B-12526]AHJ72774.1 glutamine amidotransferase [Zymomonas mobilis subsp. mobilis str. CP4 = NRRL B-14023]TWE24469.1 GMP synthase (glutamine-hydrolysing) [Zymomonas mobilis]
MKIHFIIHEAFEAPGAFEIWAHKNNYQTSYSRVYQGDSLPQPDKLDLLIILGGPQSPATTIEECPHFNAKAESRLIGDCIAAGKAVIGVCLGSQLIGGALDAPYTHSPATEIGKFPITITPEGKKNLKFTAFGDGLDVGHWHNDMPGLTAEATIIAYSEGCPRQIIEYTPLVYGFQCHMEFTAEVIELLIAASEAELKAMSDRPFVQSPDSLRQNNYDDMNRKLFSFLDKLTEAYQEQVDFNHSSKRKQSK